MPEVKKYASADWFEIGSVVQMTIAEADIDPVHEVERVTLLLRYPDGKTAKRWLALNDGNTRNLIRELGSDNTDDWINAAITVDVVLRELRGLPVKGFDVHAVHPVKSRARLSPDADPDEPDPMTDEEYENA